MKTTLASVFLASLLCIAGHEAGASPTARWSVDSYKTFDKGDAEGAFVTSLGEVRTGWKNEHVDLKFDNAWSSLLAADGTLYVGSDEQATIYKVVGDKVSTLAKVGDSVAIVSLVLDESSGTLFAGTMPDGQIWKVDTKSGKTTKLATLENAETVWSLTRAGTFLYAGTGPSGLLYKVDIASGKSTLAFDSKEKRIMSLLTTKDGGIWLGTSDSALLFRHDPKTRKTRAVADFAGNEVSALAEWNGQVIAAANEFAPDKVAGLSSKQTVDKAAKKAPAGQVTKVPAKDSKPGADATNNASVKPVAKSLRKGKGTLYRVRGDGRLTQLHALTASTLTSIVVNEQGQIFVGAADKGRVYLVEVGSSTVPGSVSTAIDVDQRYIAQLHLSAGGGLVFTTGDATGLYRSRGAAGDATYTSEAFDTKTPSKFGSVSWHGKGDIGFETRSGNTAKPGIGWSDWQTPAKRVHAVGDITRAKVASPQARYIQYRARLKSPKSSLSKTSLYYLPSNRETRIEEITVGAPTPRNGAVSEQSSSPRSPIVNVHWKVSNEDHDKTAYTVDVRREGELRWRPIYTDKNPLTKTDYKWNTETFSDGYYRLRVTASDRLTNPRSTALVSRKTTPLFVLDNERPKISGISIRYPEVSARATDALSIISAVAYAVDDGPWRVESSRDGIFDDQSELLRFRLPRGLSAGVHNLAIRVADSSGNLGSTTVSFRKK